VLCVENAWNAAGKYTWSDTADVSGFVIPIAAQSEEFWGDMFDYGAGGHTVVLSYSSSTLVHSCTSTLVQ
jgi:hypothetical protein